MPGNLSRQGDAGNGALTIKSPEKSDVDDAWQRASQVAVVGLFVIALLWGSYVAQHVIVPVLLAWTIATIVLPIVKWMEQQGLPRVVAAIAVAVLLLLLILSLAFPLSTPLAYWLGRASY